MIKQNETVMVYYWQSGAWTDDKSTADLAVECLGFSIPESIEIDIDTDIDSEVEGLLFEAETV